MVVREGSKGPGLAEDKQELSGAEQGELTDEIAGGPRRQTTDKRGKEGGLSEEELLGEPSQKNELEGEECSLVDWFSADVDVVSAVSRLWSGRCFLCPAPAASLDGKFVHT